MRSPCHRTYHGRGPEVLYLSFPFCCICTSVLVFYLFIGSLVLSLFSLSLPGPKQ